MGNVSSKTTYIYGLVDPRTNQLRYVGKTVSAPSRRLDSHMNFAKNENNKSYSYHWLRSLAGEGLRPDIFVIEEVSPFGDWTEAEQFWIAYYRFIGCRLCNVTDGGEGHCGFSPSKKTIAKIRAQRQSQKHRDRVSRQSAEMWKCRREEIIDAQNSGKGDSWKQKQSIDKIQRWKNPHNSMAVAISKRRKLLSEDVTYIKNSTSTYKILSERFDVSLSMISLIRSGRRYQVDRP